MVGQHQVRAAGARPVLEWRAVLAQKTLCLPSEPWRAGLRTTEGLSAWSRGSSSLTASDTPLGRRGGVWSEL